MLYIIFFIIIFVPVIIWANRRLTNEQSVQYEQPMHFDLLDNEGSPLEPQVKHLQYFCIKDKGYHVSVWPKDYNQIDVIEFNIAGISHRDNIDNYIGEFCGTLEAEPTNPYDPNAIKILANDGHHIGYVPKDITSEVRNNATLPCHCFCYIGNNDGTYFSDCYVLRK